MNDNCWISLAGLEELKARIDSDHAGAIEAAPTMRVVDRLEARCLEQCETIDRVIEMARHYGLLDERKEPQP